MKYFKEVIDRKEFLKSGLRIGLLGGILAVSGLLGWRKIRSTEDTTICDSDLSCRLCSKYKNCKDPKAGMSKQQIQNN